MICVILHISTTKIHSCYNPLLSFLNSHSFLIHDTLSLSLSLLSFWSDSSKNFFFITKLIFPHFYLSLPLYSYATLCTHNRENKKMLSVQTSSFLLLKPCFMSERQFQSTAQDFRMKSCCLFFILKRSINSLLYW